MFDSVVELIYHYVGNSLQGVNSAVFKEEDRLKSYVTAVDPKQIEGKCKRCFIINVPVYSHCINAISQCTTHRPTTTKFEQASLS